MFIHTVYFWLTPEATPAQRDLLVDDCCNYLSKIETVLQLWAGLPAGTDRAVVDNSYGVGLAVIFADTAGYEVYETHPLHLTFIERNKPIWSRVQVYDTLG